MARNDISDPAKKIPNGMKFLLGGLAGIGATCIVQPLDLIKTRMQVSSIGSANKEYKSSIHCFLTVITKEGPLALYEGIGAGLLRQATYTTGRLGAYAYLNQLYETYYKTEPTLFGQMLMGVAAGAAGALAGTPADVALIRMTADGRLPAEQRRNYTNVANALKRIVKEEGIATLWRGCMPTVIRAMVVNMAQLSSYSQAKNLIHKQFEMKDGIQLHFFAAMISGLLTTTVSMPVDIIKTRIQNMKDIGGKPEYQGAVDVLSKTVKQEGVLALWKGFTPYYARLGPHTVITFVFLEQFNKWYFKYRLGTTGKSDL